jgi:hypothetical protein
MYFESQELAEKFTATIAATLLDLASSSTSSTSAPSLINRQVSSSDVVNVELYATASSSTCTGTEENDSKQQMVAAMAAGKTPASSRKGNSRRKSLADFQEINDAVGSALFEADQSTDHSEANFNKAVGEQVRTELSIYLPPFSLCL